MKFIAAIRLRETFIQDGFESLDFCRKFGLPEYGRIRTAIGGQCAQTDVDEKFARKNFVEEDGFFDEIRCSLLFSVRQLKPGELLLVPDANDQNIPFRLSLDLIPERIKEIFESPSP